MDGEELVKPADGVVVIDMGSGPCALGTATCGVCGHSAFGAYDVGLERVGQDEWSWDEEAVDACPVCGLHELRVTVGAVPRSLWDRHCPSGRA